MNWMEWDVDARRRFIFDILKFIRLPLVPSKLLDAYLAECRDNSLVVALTRYLRIRKNKKEGLTFK